MRTKARLYITLALLLGSGSFSLTHAASSATDNGTTTGQRIGNIVSAVVTTAFPAVGKIISAIWPPKQQNKPVSADQAKSALTTAKNAADDAQKVNLTELTAVAQNLSVSGDFLTACSDVNASIAVMLAILPRQPNASLTQNQKFQLGDWWTRASNGIQTLKSAQLSAAVAKLDDDFLKNEFNSVIRSVNLNAENISNQLQQGRTDALKASLIALQPQLEGIAPITAQLIGDMGTSLNNASKKLAGGAGSPETNPNRDANIDLVKKLSAFNARH